VGFSNWAARYGESAIPPLMGHPGLLIQDYVAGIPIWYIPNTQITQPSFVDDFLGRAPILASTLNEITLSVIRFYFLQSIKGVECIKLYKIGVTRRSNKCKLHRFA
jgi:hypothetical protein